MLPNTRDDRDIDLVLPWRKAFPICKPPAPGDLADAERFIKEFERGADRYDLDTEWTLAKNHLDKSLCTGTDEIEIHLRHAIDSYLRIPAVLREIATDEEGLWIVLHVLDAHIRPCARRREVVLHRQAARVRTAAR